MSIFPWGGRKGDERVGMQWVVKNNSPVTICFAKSTQEKRSVETSNQNIKSKGRNSPPSVVAKRAIEQAPRRMPLALFDALVLACCAPTQSPHHQERANRQANDVEQQHGEARAEGKGGVSPFKAKLAQVGAKPRPSRLATQAATREEAERS